MNNLKTQIKLMILVDHNQK
uniref:Uncharacterized protein n=1 Tax=Rhizophora mucronata TaxID=61149 RepID=A0A2P2J1D8_RHIMU